MLCEVHRTPPASRAAKARMRARMSRAVAGSSEAVGSSRRSQHGVGEERLRQRGARLLAGGEHAAARPAQAGEVELPEHRLDARVEAAHAVERPEEAEVLLDGEVPRE